MPSSSPSTTHLVPWTAGTLPSHSPLATAAASLALPPATRPAPPPQPPLQQLQWLHPFLSLPLLTPSRRLSAVQLSLRRAPASLLTNLQIITVSHNLLPGIVAIRGGRKGVKNGKGLLVVDYSTSLFIFFIFK
ncbi:unnamed protein product [Linum trigynum]|uniref:Uncharacterized protein n=1 Tax=Linum trigynum TaxID=586398 RepID=A0AAV2EYW0_9ROSI